VIVPGPHPPISRRRIFPRSPRSVGSGATSAAPSRSASHGSRERRRELQPRVGADFQWRPSEKNQVTGQFLYSLRRRPIVRISLPNGRAANSRRGRFSVLAPFDAHVDLAHDVSGHRRRFSRGRRFPAQVGFRQGRNYLGYTFWPKSFFLSRIDTIVVVNEFFDRENRTLNRRVLPPFSSRGSSTPPESSTTTSTRSGSETNCFSENSSPIFFRQPFGALPPRFDQRLSGRTDRLCQRPEGRGGQVSLQATARPTQHLALQFNGDRQWLDVTSEQGRQGRLFTASVARLKATYTFSSRAFLRAIGQYVETRRDPTLYAFSVVRRSGNFQGSALFSYKLNWQSVLFLGYGDNRTLEESGQLAAQIGSSSSKSLTPFRNRPIRGNFRVPRVSLPSQ